MRRPPDVAMRHARPHVRIHLTVPAETAPQEDLRAREDPAETVPREHPEPDPEAPGPRDPHPQEHVPPTESPREHPEPDPEAPGPRDPHPQEDDVPATKVAHVPKKADANYSMSYRGSSQKAPSRPNAQNKKNNSSGKPSKAATQRQSMLNTHKLAPFKYDMNEILSQSSMDPGMASSFLASIIAKASRISTKDAKDYAKTFVDDGYLGKEEYDKICKLMDRYSKYR